MSRTRIKFCGIRRARDAEAAVALGVDAIGFVLVPGSSRSITADRAYTIRRRLPAFVSAVALFKDADSATIQDAVDVLRPDLLQFHGSEDAEFCASFGLPYLKAVAMADPTQLTREARRHRAAAGLLLDGHARGEMGGRGETFDWRSASTVTARLRAVLMLAGGLSARNVGQGIALLRPYAVDVSSGIESRPGVKDTDKMQDFVRAVQRADQKLNKRNQQST